MKIMGKWESVREDNGRKEGFFWKERKTYKRRHFLQTWEGLAYEAIWRQ